MGSRITDKKFLASSSPRLAVFQKPPSNHPKSSSFQLAGRKGETRRDKGMEEIRTKNSAKNFIPTERPLAIYIPISTSFRSPKRAALFIPWKECSIMQQPINETSVYRASARLISSKKRPIWINIPRQPCCKSWFWIIASPFVILGRKLRLIYLLERLCKENSPRRWVFRKIEMNSRSDSWKKFRVIFLSDVAVTMLVGMDILNSLKVFQYFCDESGK